MTGVLIRLRRAGWAVSYHGHLLLLSLLAVARWSLFGLAVLAHRAHTALAAHGQVVADTLGATGYSDRVKPNGDRYARVAYFLLDDKDRS